MTHRSPRINFYKSKDIQTDTETFTKIPTPQPLGIYFETIGNLQLANAHWRLLDYIRITSYNFKYGQISTTVKQMERSCSLGTELKLEVIVRAIQ